MNTLYSQVARGELALRIAEPVLTSNQAGWCTARILNGGTAKLAHEQNQEEGTANAIPPHMYT